MQPQGWVRRAGTHQSAAQQLPEETQHVPIVLSRALEVAAAPAPAYEGGQCAPRSEAQPLPVSLVAYHEDGRLGCARWPGGQMGMRAVVPGSPRPENSPQWAYTFRRFPFCGQRPPANTRRVWPQDLPMAKGLAQQA